MSMDDFLEKAILIVPASEKDLRDWLSEARRRLLAHSASEPKLQLELVKIIQDELPPKATTGWHAELGKLWTEYRP